MFMHLYRKCKVELKKKGVCMLSLVYICTIKYTELIIGSYIIVIKLY